MHQYFLSSNAITQLCFSFPPHSAGKTPSSSARAVTSVDKGDKRFMYDSRWELSETAENLVSLGRRRIARFF